MSKFDTHGGYFAPKDYMRVNEGGSHEENPNGGVQIGVDPEGNPNLLEEGEPVYKDYVYSDNIKAEEKFLVDNNLPKKYTGKLYSKIADDLFSEAEERPLDPTSRNGLEVLLGRLADAQEAQKQAKEQADLEAELANLSPEELDELEAMLAQQEQMPEEVPQEEMTGPAEAIPQEAAPAQMPMMANGGPLSKLDPFLKKRFPDEPSMQQQFEYTLLKDMVPEMPDFYPYDFKTRVKAQRAINDEISRQKFVERMRKREDIEKKIIDKLDEFDDRYLGNRFIREYEKGPRVGEKRFGIFDDGGPLTEEQKQAIIRQGPILDGSGVRVPSLLEMTLGSDNTIVKSVKKAQDWMQNSTAGQIIDAILPDSAIEAMSPSAKTKIVEEAMEKAYQATKTGSKLGKALKKTGRIAGDIIFPEVGLPVEAWKYGQRFGKGFWPFMGRVGISIPAAAAGAAIGYGETKAFNAISDNKRNSKKVTYSEFDPAVAPVDTTSVYNDVDPGDVKACGGKINRFGGGGKKVEDMYPMRYNAARDEFIDDIEPAVVVAEGKEQAPIYPIPVSAVLDEISKDTEPIYYDTPQKDILSDNLKRALILKSLMSDKDDDNSFLLPLLLHSYNRSNSDTGFISDYRCGGRVNRFDNGGWEDFFKALERYQGSMGKSAATGKYAIDRNAKFWNNRSARDIEAIQAYKDFTDYVKAHSDDPNVLKYFSYLDNGINRETGAKTLLNEDGTLANDWLDTFDYRRNDGDLGIYHLNPEMAFWAEPTEADKQMQLRELLEGVPFPGYVDGFPNVRSVTKDGKTYYLDTDHIKFYDNIYDIPGYMEYARKQNVALVPPENRPQAYFPELGNRSRTKLSQSGIDAGNNPDVAGAGTGSGNRVYSTRQPYYDTPIYPTWPRYAGAIGSGLLGLYNAFQQPDRYNLPEINPALPEGRIHLQNEVYNPIDQNMIANTQIAQGNATNRALRNSGLGASAGAAILAGDNNLTGNLGTGFIQAWDANNQRRNAVIAANNQAEAQRAAFDYGVSRDRAEILNNARRQRLQNELYVQMMNNQAEGDKYTAISNHIANGLQALSNIGKENFAMNQVNSNPYFLGYGAGANGVMYYNPLTGRYERIDEKKENV